MTDDRRRGSGTDPTLTPTEAIGVAETSTGSIPAAMRASGADIPARYVVGKELGAGGMGEVLLARDEQIERDVAIKRMRVTATPAAVARFVREAKIQGRLDHPAIVPVHELATDATGRPFFVMKRLTGTTLADILVSNTPPSRQKLLRAFADVCLAIEFAHARGVIHRDLKPANIMLGDFGEVYVLDWGVARLTDETHDGVDPVHVIQPTTNAQTEVGAILGTPGFIAPEILRGEPLEPRADVYALGCILFEILTGEALVPRGQATLDPQLEKRPSGRTPERDIAPELDEICVAALATEPLSRPTAHELAERIERFLDGDRDVALRKSLAATHLEAARTALAKGDGVDARSIAMREAGRAIALDPHDSSAAELVGRLMLEPPREVPREVDERVEEVESGFLRSKVRLMESVMLAFLFVVPGVVVTGLRSYVPLVAFLVVLALNLAATSYVARRAKPPSQTSVIVGAVLFALLVVLFSRTFSPFLLAPTIAAISVIMFLVDPRAPWRLVTAIFMLATLLPWLAEFIGAVPRTMTTVGGDLLLKSDMVDMRFPEGEIAFAVYVFIMLLVAGYTAHQLGLRHRVAMRSIELQAWHLRQLVRR